MTRFRLERVEHPSGKAYALNDVASKRRPLVITFDSPAFLRRLRAAGKKSELVVRATRAGPGRSVLDCTAGLGRDGFLLAHLGCTVTMIERSPVIATLLADALRRAKEVQELAPAVERISLVQGDASDVLLRADHSRETVYIDPMFPESTGSAAVKGDMQALQDFLGHDEDAATLLLQALASGAERVVVKRPGKGSWNPPVKPLHVFTSKGSNFEAYDAGSDLARP